jgi:hypothetical protein
MKNTIIVPFLIFVGAAFSSCNKDKTALSPVETYKLTGKINPTFTSIPTAVLTKAEFILSFNTPNSFGDAQSVINGSLEMTGYTGIVPVQGGASNAFFVLPNGAPDTVVSRTYTADTVAFFGIKADGTSVSYLIAPAVKTISYKPTPAPTLSTSVVFTSYVTNFYTFTNTPNASFSFTNFPFTNDITSLLKNGGGIFRIGKFPKYVYINLDTVTKL